MIPGLVTCFQELIINSRMFNNIFANTKEGSLNLMFIQNRQNSRRGFRMRTIIKSQINFLFFPRNTPDQPTSGKIPEQRRNVVKFHPDQIRVDPGLRTFGNTSRRSSELWYSCRYPHWLHTHCRYVADLPGQFLFHD